MKRAVTIVVALTGIAAQVAVAQTVTPINALRVEDQNGRNAGLAEAGGAGFFLKAGDVYVRISVSRTRLDGTQNILWYESADCTGQALLQVNPDQLAGYGPSHVGPGPDYTLFTPRVGATPAPVVVNSRSDGSACTPRSPGTEIDAVAADPFVDLGPLYTPPFRLAEVTAPAAGCCGDCDGNGEVAINELLTGVGSALSGCTAQ